MGFVANFMGFVAM